MDAKKYTDAFRYLQTTSPMYRDVKLHEDRFEQDPANTVDFTDDDGGEEFNALLTKAFHGLEHSIYHAPQRPSPQHLPLHART